jgi:glucose-6-phosphate isomerase
MITLKTSALSQISPKHGLSAEEMASLNAKLPEYLQGITARGQGFYTPAVVENSALVNEIEAYAKSVDGKFDHIVLLGIGGSSLGPIALREAFGNSFNPARPQLIVLDNIDPDFLAEAEQAIELSKTLFLVVSKSGTTPETASQYYYFADKIAKAGLAQDEHMVFITDTSKGVLREVANQNDKIVTFPIPDDVGGRFSVLTAVGLLPAALIGIDIKAMLGGAKQMADAFQSTDASCNLPFQLAVMQYLLMQKGKSQNVMYSYSQKLFRMADWFRQLLAESTGKRYADNGKEIFTGLTPIAALGATDQHSQNQLYFEGPNDKFFLFLEIGQFKNHLPIPAPVDDERFTYLKNADFGTLLTREKEGTEGALSEMDRPHITIEIPTINEQHIGEFFLLLEGATAFMGEMLQINAFDQPAVELSKNITKKLLLESQ